LTTDLMKLCDLAPFDEGMTGMQPTPLIGRLEPVPFGRAS
jgi:hypothetical protein